MRLCGWALSRGNRKGKNQMRIPCGATNAPTRPSRDLVTRFGEVYKLPADLLLASAVYGEDVLAELNEEARLMLVMFEQLPAEQRKVALELIHVLASRYVSSPPTG